MTVAHPSEGLAVDHQAAVTAASRGDAGPELQACGGAARGAAAEEAPAQPGLRCPDGHALAPVALRFYQGFMRNRGCGLCGARIWRDEVRHRCDACNFDACLRCFERHHLERARLGPSAPGAVPPHARPTPRRARAASEGTTDAGTSGGGGSSGSDSEVTEVSGVSEEDEEGEERDEEGEERDEEGPDGLAGRGALAIPGALLGVSLQPAGAPGAEPPLAQDLRRFLRPGDILNYLGGNRWGHTVLVLSAPRLCGAPALFDAGPPRRRLAAGAPAYLATVLQSASNMREIGICTCCLVVHPATGLVCPARETRGGLRLLAGRDGRPVHVEALLSPWSDSTLDLDTFRLAVEEVHRAPQDCKWSFKTAVRSYLKDAAMDPQRYKTRERKLQAAAKISSTWRQRPVCSTVPPRVWQKYLLKMCQRGRAALPTANGHGMPVQRGSGAGSHLLYCGSDLPPPDHATASETGSLGHCGSCGPLEGPQCDCCLLTQWALPSDDPDPEVAWVEDILRLMPVKDDRVLPRELSGILLDTRLWRRLDLAAGPPAHRRGDAPRAQAPVYERPWREPLARAVLPAGAQNAEGAPVRLGRDGFTVYCGRRVSRPRALGHRLGHGGGERDEPFQWDGCCGPEIGPQCAPCRRLEDRLLA